LIQTGKVCNYSIGEYKSLLRQEKKLKTLTEIQKESIAKMKESKQLVAVAISSNVIMFCAKAYGAVESGSASMFAESMHSIADVLNESLLLWGLFRSLKKADIEHPYGFTTEKYAWALVSGVGVFFLGGGVTLYHGFSGLVSGGHQLSDISPALWALSGCLLFETSCFFLM
jgi:zinc transporter 9